MKRNLFSRYDSSRRDFIENLAKVCLGTAVLGQTKWLKAAETAGNAAPQGKAKSVIYLYMIGGMSHVDTLDPKPENSSVKGPFGAVQAGASVYLGDQLARVAKSFSDVAVIRSLTSKEGDHRRARYQLHTSYPPLSSVQHPSIGSWISKTATRLNQELPPYFTIGEGGFNSGFFANEYDPFRVGDPETILKQITPTKPGADEDLKRRLSLLGDLQGDFVKEYGAYEPVKDYSVFYDKALTLMRSKDLEAFDLTKEKSEQRDRYGRNPFGQGVLLARRLTERGVRFVEVSLGNWDMHDNLSTRLPPIAQNLDQALSALLADLKQTGRLSETVVVLATEFGRDPRFNGDGRGHHPRAFSALLAGGGIKGGQVYGATGADGDEVKENPVTMMDFNATIAQALGLNPSEETISPVGRPFRLAGGGKPILSLFS